MPTSVSTRSPGSPNPTRQQLDELDALLQRMLELPVDPLDEENPAEADDPSPPAARPEETKSPSYTVIETASPRPLPAPPKTPPTPENVAEAEPEPRPSTSVETPTSDEETWVPLRSTWKPSAQTWQPLAESWRQANTNATPPAAVPRPVPSPPPEPPPPAIAPPPAPQPIAAVEQTPTPSETAPVAEEEAIEPPLSLTAEDAPSTVAMPSLLPLVWFNQGFDACVTPLGGVGRWLCGSSGRQVLGLAGLACLAAAVIVALSAGMAWPW